MRRFVDQCDVLFLSQRHRDHVDEWTAQAFIDVGRPVVAPPQVWEGTPIHSTITHVKREAHTKQPFQMKGGSITLQVVIFPGHQMSKTENNVSLIFTPEGIRLPADPNDLGRIILL